MGIDFFAWGFIDPFFSVYADFLLENLFLVGLIVSVKGFIGLIALAPLSEIIRVKSSRMVAIIGRLGALLTVILYFCAGIFHLPALLFVGAIFHGIGGAARDVATRDYLMEASSKQYASTILGTNFSIRHMSWMIAAVAGGYFLYFVTSTSEKEIHHVIPILFAIAIPFYISSIYLLKKLSPNKTTCFPFCAFKPARILKKEFRLFQHFFHLNLQIKFSMLLICFLQVIQSSLLLFLPILAFQMQLSIAEIGLLMASVYAPMLLSAIFSVFEDRTDRMLFIIGGLMFSVLPLIILSQVEAPLFIGISAVLTSLSLAIIMPANLGTIAANTERKDSPQIAALQIIFQRLGMLIGALLIGSISELYTIQTAFVLIAILAIIFAIFATIVKIKYRPEKKVPPWRFTHIHPLHPHLLHIHHTL